MSSRIVEIVAVEPERMFVVEMMGQAQSESMTLAASLAMPFAAHEFDRKNFRRLYLGMISGLKSQGWIVN